MGATFSPDPNLPGWTIWAEEVSMGVYQVGALHKDGRSVSHTGTDTGELLRRVRADAKALSEKPHA